MALTNKNVGARIRLPIGRQGEAPDIIPARIVGAVKTVPGPRGMQEVAEVVMFKTTQKGDQILQPRLQNLYFAFDRSEAVPALDGTAAEPKTVSQLVTEAGDQLLAYLMAGGGAQSADLEDIEV